MSELQTSFLPGLHCLTGHRLAFPMLVAPMAMHGMAHPGKEIATARAAAAEGIPMVGETQYVLLILQVSMCAS